MAEAITSPTLHKILSPTYQEKIKRVDLNLSKIGFSGKIAYVLDNVFSKEECEELIAHTESLGYVPALIHAGNMAFLMKNYRDSERVMIDDKEFAKILFQRIGHLLPQTFKSSPKSKTWKLLEINERLRFLKYEPGGNFKAHYDGQYARPDGSAITQITLQIYLNGGMKGGETTFLRDLRRNEDYEDVDLLKAKNRVPVKPKPGRILVFEHEIFHEGTKVKDGLKYTIRCDALYKQVNNNSEDENEGDGEHDGEMADNKKGSFLKKNCIVL